MKLLFVACLLLVTSMAQAQRCETLLEKTVILTKRILNADIFYVFCK